MIRVLFTALVVVKLVVALVVVAGMTTTSVARWSCWSVMVAAAGFGLLVLWRPRRRVGVRS